MTESATLTSASLIMPEALDFLSSKATLQLSVSTVAFMSGLFVMIPLLFHYITNLTLFQAFSIFFSTHSSKLPYKWITILKNEASGISVGENPLIALTSELFLDSEPEAKNSHRVSGLPLTGSERNATMTDRR